MSEKCPKCGEELEREETKVGKYRGRIELICYGCGYWTIANRTPAQERALIRTLRKNKGEEY